MYDQATPKERVATHTRTPAAMQALLAGQFGHLSHEGRHTLLEFGGLCGLGCFFCCLLPLEFGGLCCLGGDGGTLSP